MDIHHDVGRTRFCIEVDGKRCVLDYETVSADTLDYRHTFVPPALRGQGLATRLVLHALDYAKAHGLRVIPSCPFVARVMRDHPEYEPLREPSSAR